MLGLSWQFTDIESFERAVLVGDSATGANVLLVALLDGPLVGVTGSNDKRIDGPFDASGDGFTDGILVRSVTYGLLVGRGTLDGTSTRLSYPSSSTLWKATMKESKKDIWSSENS
jgi:hypothetical protein